MSRDRTGRQTETEEGMHTLDLDVRYLQIDGPSARDLARMRKRSRAKYAFRDSVDAGRAVGDGSGT